MFSPLLNMSIIFLQKNLNAKIPLFFKPRFFDNAAAYFLTRISRRLSAKIIYTCVNNYRFPYNVLYIKAVCQNCHKRISSIGQKRRQISCMFGVRYIFRVIVTARFGKSRSLTAVTSVNMHCKKSCRTVLRKPRQTSHNKNSVFSLYKVYPARKLRRTFSAYYLC